MSTRAHTPGPWVLTSDPYEDGTPYFKFSAGAGLFAEGGFNFSAIMSEADARLIVAAQTLLTELDVRVGDLVMLRKAIEAGDPKQELLVRIDDMLRETRAAIAKAGGAP